MNELALFAGIGGGLLGSKLLGWRTVCYVEWEKYCIEVLRTRIAEGYLHDAPIWNDVSTFNGKPWRGKVDIITAGFPCQPFSVAGKRRGSADSRNKWPDTIRIIREVRPTYILLENVPALLANEYMGEIFGSLAESGYHCRWDCIRASDVGAPHRRERLWVVAYSRHRARRNIRSIEKGNNAQARWASDPDTVSGSGDESSDVAYTGKPRTGMEKHRGGGQTRQPAGTPQPEILRQELRASSPEGVGASGEDVADTHQQGSQGYRGCSDEQNCACQFATWACCRTHEDQRLARSGIRRISYGVPKRVDRLKALGNAQVPEVVRTAWELLTKQNERK